MKFSSKVKKCGLSPMRKFHPYAVAAQAAGKKIYHLNIGQPDIETPPQYFQAVRDFRQPVLEYAPSPGLPVLIDAIQKYYDNLGIHFEKDEILITTGGSEALQIVLNCILDEGDEIIIPEPFYPNYNTMVSTCGASIRPVSTVPEEGYHYADRSKIEAAITPRTRAIMCTNPGNPTGNVLTPEEMRMMVDVAKEHELFIIGDEAYREFVYASEPLQSLGEFKDAAENVIVIDTVSKRFSACGARIGCIISRNKELMGEAIKYCQARLSVATLDQVASAALYDVGPDYFAAVREEYKRRRDTVVSKLKEIPGVICECPRGAFYLMAALPVDDADEFQQWLLTDFDDNSDTVMFAPGGSFYATPGKGINEIRIAYVLKQKDLERAMDLLSMGILAYNSRLSPRTFINRPPGLRGGAAPLLPAAQFPLHEEAESLKANGLVKFSRLLVEGPHIQFDAGKALFPCLSLQEVHQLPAHAPAPEGFIHAKFDNMIDFSGTAVGRLLPVQVFYQRHAADHAVPLRHYDVAVFSAPQRIGPLLQFPAKSGPKNVGPSGGMELIDLASQLVHPGQVPLLRVPNHSFSPPLSFGISPLYHSSPAFARIWPRSVTAPSLPA